MRKAAAAVVLASLGVLAAGCPLDPRTDPKEDLMISVRAFNDGVHWGNLEPAARLVAPELRARWSADAERVAKEVSFSFYEVRRIELREKATRADVRVEVGWWHVRALIERKTTLVEKWVRRKGTWVLAATEIADGPPIGG